MKKIISLFLVIIILTLSFTGCEYYESRKRIHAVTYENAIFDHAQNLYTYSGIRMYASQAVVSYFENLNPEEFKENMALLMEESHDFIWCLEPQGKDIILSEYPNHPERLYAIMDTKIENIPSNFITVSFREEEGGFLAGYIAAKSTQVGKVAYLGGKETDISKKYELGFLAGIEYAAKELGTYVLCDVKYIGDDYNNALAKEAALSLYNEGGCDIIFDTLANGGTGAIEAAEESQKFIIGSGAEQSTYGYSSIIAVVVKNTKVAVSNLISKYIDKELKMGVNYEYGIKERMIDLSKTTNRLNKKVDEDVNNVKYMISKGEIVVPKTLEELEVFKVNLNTNI